MMLELVVHWVLQLTEISDIGLKLLLGSALIKLFSDIFLKVSEEMLVIHSVVLKETKDMKLLSGTVRLEVVSIEGNELVRNRDPWGELTVVRVDFTAIERVVIVSIHLVESLTVIHDVL